MPTYRPKTVVVPRSDSLPASAPAPDPVQVRDSLLDVVAKVAKKASKRRGKKGQK